MEVVAKGEIRSCGGLKCETVTIAPLPFGTTSDDPEAGFGEIAFSFGWAVLGAVG